MKPTSNNDPPQPNNSTPSEKSEFPSDHIKVIKQDTPPTPQDETDFESFYLKQVTTEFADDLDKLRNASDFTEKSVPILIDALKATAGMYSEGDKMKVMGKR
ncbi:MAG: hypothetical protein Q9185_004154 [Variospora sp. 1 TL-2023]